MSVPLKGDEKWMARKLGRRKMTKRKKWRREDRRVLSADFTSNSPDIARENGRGGEKGRIVLAFSLSFAIFESKQRYNALFLRNSGVED